MSTFDRERLRAADAQHHRDLWSAVVLQAKDDIASEPLNSADFAQAVAFFIGSGEWAQHRTAIGDFIELHPDDLEKLGRRCINNRRASEGLDPLLPRQPWPARPRTPRQVEHLPQPEAAPPPPPAPRPPPAPGRPAFNQFFPRGIYPQPPAQASAIAFVASV